MMSFSKVFCPCGLPHCKLKVKKRKGRKDKHESLSLQSKVHKVLHMQVYNGNLPTCDSIYIKDSA